MRPWLHHTCPKSGWKLRPKHSSVRSFVRPFVGLFRPSVRQFRRNQTSSSLPSRACSLVALVLLLSLARLARPHLLSCFRCYGFVTVSGARLLISIFCCGFFFGSWTFFFCMFWRSFRNPSNSAVAAFVLVRGFCCLHVHVSSVWLSIVGDVFISLSQLAVCCTFFL